MMISAQTEKGILGLIFFLLRGIVNARDMSFFNT